MASNNLDELINLIQANGHTIQDNGTGYIFTTCPDGGHMIRIASNGVIEMACLDKMAGATKCPEGGAWKALGLGNHPSAPEAAPSSFRGTLMRRSELAKLPPIEPLIVGVMSRRSVVVLVGQTGAGKTFLSLAWACSVGTGKAWLGKPVHRAKVLYVVGEGAYGLDERVSAWEKAWRTEVTDEDVIFSIKPQSLLSRELWEEVTAEAIEIGAGLIVFDTFSSLAPDADETKDAPMIMRRMSDLAAATEATTLLVHHPGWGDVTRARGGSQLESNADEVLILHGSPKSDLIELERKKVKEGPAGARRWLRRKPSNNSVIIEYVDDSEVRREALTALDDIILETFGDQTFSATALKKLIMERTGVSDSQAYKNVTKLRSSGVIVTVGGTDSRPIYKCGVDVS